MEVDGGRCPRNCGAVPLPSPPRRRLRPLDTGALNMAPAEMQFCLQKAAVGFCGQTRERRNADEWPAALGAPKIDRRAKQARK